MEAILDSSFVISCIKQNIDFIEQLEGQGFKVRVPHEVLEELKDLRARSRQMEKMVIDLALEMLGGGKVKQIKLGHKKVDDALIEKGKEGYYIATLDREIKRQVPHRIVIFSAKKSVGVE